MTINRHKMTLQRHNDNKNDFREMQNKNRETNPPQIDKKWLQKTQINMQMCRMTSEKPNNIKDVILKRHNLRKEDTK